MIHLVFFLEEPSAREMLKGLLPRLLSDETIPQYVVFEGKQDLKKQLGKKLRGWRRPDSRFVVLCDQDGADCLQVKSRLVEICRQAGKPDALVRIVCRELESWYLGDLRAVERGMHLSGLAGRQKRSKYRDPDRFANPVQELERMTRHRYQKVSGSREIGRRLSVGSVGRGGAHGNRSRSFQVFVSGLRERAG